MKLYLPDWLRYEARHRIERLRDGYERLHVRESINDNPKAVAGVAFFSALLLAVVLALVFRPAPARRYEEGSKAWFYDQNTGKLFVASSKEPGPTTAPSGPLPGGGPAAFRAHVYSYVLGPNQAELFVGFLERPDPNAGSERQASDRSDFHKWARGTLIRRADGVEWVPATSAAGREIIQELTRPNQQGQTPIYQLPK